MHERILNHAGYIGQFQLNDARKNMEDESGQIDTKVTTGKQNTAHTAATCYDGQRINVSRESRLVSKKGCSMAINDHLQTFAGKRVVNWDPNRGIEDPERTISRLSISYDYSSTQSIDWADYFASFLADPRAHESTGLVVGVWDSDGGNNDIESVIETLVAAHEQLSRLKALFIGDIISVDV